MNPQAVFGAGLTLITLTVVVLVFGYIAVGSGTLQVQPAGKFEFWLLPHPLTMPVVCTHLGEN